MRIAGQSLARRSTVGIVVGAFIALAGPSSFWLLAVLLDAGIVPRGQIRPFLDAIGLIAWLSLAVLAPLGIAVVGRSAGITRLVSWLALLVISLPSFAAFWFVSVAMLSGSLGNPF